MSEMDRARERLTELRKRAARRIADAPDYPDDPDEAAEQEAIARALAKGQARAQANVAVSGVGDVDEMVAWLRRQLDDDEAAARAVEPLGETVDMGFNVLQHTFTHDRTTYASEDGYPRHQSDPAAAAHFSRHDPVRVLADVAAKRAILEAFEVAEQRHRENLDKFSRIANAPAHSYDQSELTQVRTHGWELDGRRLALRFAVKAVASAYADRPGYRDAWRPT